MQNEPQVGPIHERWGPYIKNIQEIAHGIWIADAQRGTQGKGKQWNPTILIAHPEAGQPTYTPHPGYTGDVPVWPDFTDVGRLKRVPNGGRKDMWNVQFWSPSGDYPRMFIEAYFGATEHQAALDFLLTNARTLKYA